ncbi:CBO0543 family protein [Bacillus sp. OTU2372]|uniref:CBO0543 family protein n=1 Tax=Bacillus sp. OTU2372 TaxID=3043858 RepID=UPI00313B1801
MYSHIEKMGSRYHSLEAHIWIHQDVFSIQWWTIVLLNALFFILLIILIDRSRILLISLAFVVNFIIVGLADEIGTFYDRWSYPHQLLIFTHRLNAVDFAIVPVLMALCYQFFSKWKVYLLAEVIISAVMCFIGIPVFVYFNMYKLENWNYLYSFIVTILMFILSKMILDFLRNKGKRYSH